MTALITAIAVLDILDVLRVVPVLVKALFLEEIFRHVFCSLGVFHELAVAIFLVSLSIAICFQVELSSCIANYVFMQHKITHTYESRILKRRRNSTSGTHRCLVNTTKNIQVSFSILFRREKSLNIIRPAKCPSCTR